MKGQKYPCYMGANRFHTLGGVHIECLPCPIPHQCPPSILNRFDVAEGNPEQWVDFNPWTEFWKLCEREWAEVEKARELYDWEIHKCDYCRMNMKKRWRYIEMDNNEAIKDCQNHIIELEQKVKKQQLIIERIISAYNFHRHYEEGGTDTFLLIREHEKP